MQAIISYRDKTIEFTDPTLVEGYITDGKFDEMSLYYVVVYAKYRVLKKILVYTRMESLM